MRFYTHDHSFYVERCARMRFPAPRILLLHLWGLHRMLAAIPMLYNDVSAYCADKASHCNLSAYHSVSGSHKQARSISRADYSVSGAHKQARSTSRALHQYLYTCDCSRRSLLQVWFSTTVFLSLWPSRNDCPPSRTRGSINSP